MNFLNNFVSSNNSILIIILLFLIVLQFIIIAYLFTQTKKPKRKISSDNIDSESLIQEIENLDNKIESIYEYSKSVNNKADATNLEIKKTLRNIGIERFDAFGDGGGNHSFSVAILDDHKNGFIIKSIYARETTRVYTTPIQNNENIKELPIEDQNAIKNAYK